MKDEDIERPQAMKIRQGIQDAMTQSLPEKRFSESNIDLVEVDIELNNLGWNFNNFKILNLTDIHLGQWINPEYLDELIDYVNTLNVDIVTLTGDYFSYNFADYEKCLEKSLKKLNANEGKFGVLGNHDHWMDAPKVREIFKNAGIIQSRYALFACKKVGAKIAVVLLVGIFGCMEFCECGHLRISLTVLLWNSTVFKVAKSL